MTQSTHTVSEDVLSRLRAPVWRLSAILVLAFVCGFLISWRSTSVSPGFTPDSVTYLSAARHLLAGKGYVDHNYFKPITIYPPVFPVLLALTGASNQGARLLLAVLFGLNALLTSYLCYRITGSLLSGLIAASLFLSTGSQISVHKMVFSEPSFLFFALSCFIVLISYKEKRNKRFLVCAGVLASLACLTRYVGISVCFAGIASILYWNRKERIGHAILFSFIALFPLTVWFLRNHFLVGTLYVDAPQGQPWTASNAALLLRSIKPWLGNPTGAYPILIIAACVGAYSWKPAAANRQNRLHFPAVAYSILYPSVYLGATTVFSTFQAFDGRALAPLYPFLLVLFLSACDRLPKWIPPLRPIVGLLLCLVSMLALLRLNQRDAIGYSNPNAVTGIKESLAPETLKAVQTLDEKTVLLSNMDDYIWLFSGRPCYRLPYLYLKDRSQKLPGYEERILWLKDQMKGNGVIVYVRAVQRPGLSTEDELKQLLPLKLLKETSDGALYALMEP